MPIVVINLVLGLAARFGSRDYSPPETDERPNSDSTYTRHYTHAGTF